jgi:hypothetical protein
MMARRTSLLAGALASVAMQGPPRRLVVGVGEVMEVDVDYKVGVRCDDREIIRVWMVQRGQHNWFIVEGISPGSTWCRVGTDPNVPSYLYEIVVDETREANVH